MPEERRFERRLAAVLMMDVAGYSRLMSVDEEGTYARLRDKLTSFVEPGIAEAGGRIVKRTGDGALVEFPSAADAVRCAVAIQLRNEADEQPRDAERRVRFRIGISLGEVIVENGDIFGDGVNIAARLETTAEVGGISLSEAAAMDSRDGGYAFLDLGLKSLRNIARPIRVYKVALQGETGDSGHVAGTSLVHGFGERPAIAVLPFRTEGGDAEQSHLADGITEDVITALSRWRSFPVISRASVFAFKGKDLEPAFVGQQLGARYLTDSTLRRRGSRLRATVHLTDAETGENLLAEQFDYDISDVFEMQDEIVRTIVGAIEPELLRHERERVMREPMRNPTAYEMLQRGLWHHYRYTPDDNAKARQFFREVLALDPGNSQAAAALSLTLGYAAQARFESDQKTVFQEARELARRAVDADSRSPQARFAFGNTLFHTGMIVQAARELQEATRLNPSHAAAHANLGFVYNYLDRPDEALVAIELAMRLSPHDPRRFIWLPALAGSNYLAGNYTAALSAGHEALAANASYLPVVRYIVAALGRLGRPDGAKAVMPLLLKLDGDLAGTEAHLGGYFVPAAVARITEGLRLAGFT